MANNAEHRDFAAADEVREFQLHMIREKKLALGTVALRMGALRFLYKRTLRRRDIDIEDLPLVRAPKKLPVVLSPEVVIRLIEAAPNMHHRTLLLLLYSLIGPYHQSLFRSGLLNLQG